MKRFAFRMLLSLALCLGLAGCGSLGQPHSAKSSVPSANSDVLQVGEMVYVGFSGISSPPADYKEQIKDDGSITPPYVGRIQAARRTTLQLQQELQADYNKYFRNLVVTVGADNRFFYVLGQVVTPNRYPWSGQMTVTKAVATAGGFTDYANRKRVQLRRAEGQVIRVNAQAALANPSLDLPVYPGDSINVPRRYF